MGIPLNEIPGLAEKVRDASRQEEAIRDLPFLGVELELCGVAVRQFTPRHFLYLDVAGNPFLRGGEIGADDVALFLWVVSPQFVPGHTDTRDAFVCGLVNLPYAAAVEAISDYLDQAFMDRPVGGKTGAVPVTGFLAAVVDELATAYGWSREVIMDLPFAEIFQYWRRIALRRDPGAKFINRLSDRARRESVAEYLESQRSRKEDAS